MKPRPLQLVISSDGRLGIKIGESYCDPQIGSPFSEWIMQSYIAALNEAREQGRKEAKND